jgi:replicative DNA helicase
MNPVTEKLTSLQVEKQLLGGLYKNQNVFLEELDGILKETDFSNKLHEILFSILKNHIIEGKNLDKILWAQKFKELNIGTRDEISNIFEYVDAICSTNLNAKGCLNNAKELVKLRIRRDVYKDAQEVQSFITSPKCADKTVLEIINEVDGIYNKRINTIVSDDEPIDLFAGIEDYIKGLVNNPQKGKGLITPFNQYNKWFGGMQASAGSYVFSARLSEGKSVWMFNLAKGIALLNQCKVLYLDTEMDKDLNMDRAAAAQAGMNPFWLREGAWTKNAGLTEKMMKAFPEFKKMNNLFFYQRVANKGIKEILSIARKWKLKHVGREEKAFVVLDYLKINGENTSDSRNEWQVFGDWTSYINDFGASYNAVTSIAAQQNRTAVQQDGTRNYRDTTIGGSDRIAQFARFCALVGKKTFDEMTEHGPQFGTHMFVPVKYARDQGEKDYLTNGMIRIPAENGRSKVAADFLNLTMENYDVREAGTHRDIIEHQRLAKNLDSRTPNTDTDTTI